MLDAVRRRTTAAHRLRRGQKGDPEWINRRRLLRAAERLTDEQRHTLFEKLTSADPNGDIAAAWIAKELLRDVLACSARGGLRYEISAALYAFYTFCAACSVPEIRQLAETISSWQEPMILAIQTGLSNARREGFKPDRQTRRPRRVRLQDTGESTPPSTVGLHPPITASAIQNQTAAPLLSRMSPIYRRMVATAFTPRFVAKREEAIRRIADDLIQQIPVGTPVEFVTAFAAPLPLRIIAHTLNVPDDRTTDFKRLSDQVTMTIGAETDEAGALEQVREHRCCPEHHPADPHRRQRDLHQADDQSPAPTGRTSQVVELLAGEAY